MLTSILTSEVTDIAPQPQFELGDMLGTQSGTWGNLVQHMCKSQQTTSVKTLAICKGGGVKNWSNLPTYSSKKLPPEGGRGQKL